MKILLAVDGSVYSEAAVQEVIRRPWPKDTEVEVFSAVQAAPETVDPMLVGHEIHLRTLEMSTARARENVAEAAETLRQNAPQLAVHTKVAEGPARDAIVEEAEDWGADLIMVGSHGYGAALRLLLGSVSHAVVQRAPCSVEIVRVRAQKELAVKG